MESRATITSAAKPRNPPAAADRTTPTRPPMPSRRRGGRPPRSALQGCDARDRRQRDSGGARRRDHTDPVFDGSRAAKTGSPALEVANPANAPVAATRTRVRKRRNRCSIRISSTCCERTATIATSRQGPLSSPTRGRGRWRTVARPSPGCEMSALPRRGNASRSRPPFAGTTPR